MYVYVIKCVNYYKIGISKNPTSRRATIQTHNPLDVKICATLKTEHAREVESELHRFFATKRSRGEWFELKHDDLKILKIQMGFTFKIPLSKIFDDGDYDNSTKNLATQNVRKRNLDVEDLKQYFESLYDCDVIEIKNIKKCVVKYGHECVKSTIQTMYEKDYQASYVINGLLKFCESTWLKTNNPQEYFIKRLKGMFWGRYHYSIDAHDLNSFRKAYMRILDEYDIEYSLKVFQSESYRCELGELLEYIECYG